MASQGIGVRPVAAGHNFADHGHRRCAGLVITGKLASGYQRNAHGLEIRRRNHIESCGRLLSRGRGRLALGAEEDGRAGLIEAGSLYPGQVLRAIEQLPEKQGLLGSRGVLVLGQVKGHGHDIAGIDAQIHLHEAEKRSHQQAGAGQQHQGEGGFGYHQTIAQAAAAGLRRRGHATFLQRVVQIGFRGGQSGRKTKDDARHHGDAQAVEQNPPVEPDDAGVGHAEAVVPRHLQGKQAVTGPGQCQAQGSSDRRQHHALREQLRDQTPPVGADGDPHGHLASSSGGPGQQQIGDIGAGDEQDEKHRSGHDEERGGHLAVVGRVQRLNLDTPALVGIGILRRQGGGQRVHAGLRLLHADARLETGLGLQIARGTAPGFAAFRRSERQGHKNIHLLIPRKAKSGGHHAHDGVAFFVEIDGPTEDPRVARVAGEPQAVANNRHLVVARLRLLCREKPAHQRLNAEQGQHSGRRLNPVDALGMVPLGDGEVRPTVVAGLLKDFRVPSDVVHVGGGYAGLDISLAALVAPLSQADELVGVRIGERPQHDGIHQAEDGGVGTDAQTEGEDGNGGKAWTAEDLPQRIAKILVQVLSGFHVPLAS